MKRWPGKQWENAPRRELGLINDRQDKVGKGQTLVEGEKKMRQT